MPAPGAAPGRAGPVPGRLGAPGRTKPPGPVPPGPERPAPVLGLGREGIMPGLGRGPPGRGGMPEAPPGRGMLGGLAGRGGAPGVVGRVDVVRGPVPNGLLATRGAPGRGPGTVPDSVLAGAAAGEAAVGAGAASGAAVAAIGSGSGVRMAGPGIGAPPPGAGVVGAAVTLGVGAVGDVAGNDPFDSAAAGAEVTVFLAGAVLTGAAAAGIASRSLRTTGASTVDDGPFTYSPSSPSLTRTSLLVTPSSFASSWTRGLPGTALLLEGEPGGRPRWL